MISNIAKQLFALALLLTVASVALAQQGAVRGVVKGKLSDADTPKPVEGAIVDIYRLDITQKYQTKTDKKGEFFHTLPAFGEFIVSVSAPNYGPIFSGKFKVAGDVPQEQNFELVPGDGSRLTLEQIKAAKTQEQKSAQDPAAAKAEAERIAKEREEITKRNEKAKAEYEEMKKHFDAGNQLAKNNDYENAIKEYREALKLDDAQTSVYFNLAQSLFNLGAVRFNAKKKDEALDLFKQSAEYGEKATKLDAQSPLNFKIYGDACDILFKQFHIPEFADKAIAAYQTGSDLELDKIKKSNMINRIASIHYLRAEYDKSNAIYEKLLATDPDNIEALKGKASIILVTTTTNTTPEDKARLEQAMGIFQQVVDKLQDPAQKAEVESFIAYLKDTMKIEVKKETGKKDKKDDKKKK